MKYPPNFAPPLEVAVEASNGASDYGNKFGEPVLAGFARSFGMTLPEGERREYIKPIMFSGGIGALDGRHVHKAETEKGKDVCSKDRRNQMFKCVLCFYNVLKSILCFSVLLLGGQAR